ncbi:phosphonate degradation operons associated HDIG domain protein [Tistlia consotensis]|uniref:Phosphonate degradation operons associated HDIG domain protein n=1 Tax=Tistlia consotensis USBA 355 TaxID=560819 RepID=A0A1Y6B2P8_9PROT|nr:phosphonate degradation HD-domain oxygenase [Tistlia consotensis]SME88485.1 phosphonate degradation operons associated HDIG domain protein [Tistlia consotensis USBA 355]SNR24945.1 phosphonate degradation operons associated HDIG domain protein [Tistlia consotensis]
MDIETLFGLFDAKGAESYGESVTQIEHALQCAHLAEAEGASGALVTAALLHDVGHLLHRDTRAAYERAVDDRHEALAAKALAGLFGPEVCEPIRLHVDAKRYLCLREPGYFGSLSPTSVMTLRLQGGPMDAAEADAFERDPHFEDAVRLRRWDEGGKVPDRATPALAHFRAIAERCLAPTDR